MFAVTGVGTAFFSPSLFVQSGIPTYGYNVTGTGPPAEPLRRRRVGAVLPGGGAAGRLCGQEDPDDLRFAFLAYGIAASADACQAEQNALTVRRLQHQLLRPQGQLPGYRPSPPTCSA